MMKNLKTAIYWVFIVYDVHSGNIVKLFHSFTTLAFTRSPLSQPHPPPPLAAPDCLQQPLGQRASTTTPPLSTPWYRSDCPKLTLLLVVMY